MDTFRHATRRIDTQEVVPFTGEGAYHGSTRKRAPAGPPPPLVEEMRPRTLERYAAEGRTSIADFDAVFPNRFELLEQLPVPSQQAIRDDGVTFCWCPFEVARTHAGPVIAQVLDAMEPHLMGDRRNVYIDAKIQYFQAGDVPVDSHAWHLDGTIAVRDERVQALGHRLLHDMPARLDGQAPMPVCMSYQSSSHCATEFATGPLTVRLPELVPDFGLLDERVRALDPPRAAQEPATLVRFDGGSLHRAVVARDAGWRLWVRCFETDREVRLTSQIIDCYGQVFRVGPQS